MAEAHLQAPLAAKIAVWIAARDKADELLERWQGLETELMHGHGAISPREAERRGIPAGRAMRLLDLEYRAMARALKREIRFLAARQATTLADAVAKIELGLRIMDSDPEDEASVAIRDGFRVIRHVLSAEPTGGILVNELTTESSRWSCRQGAPA